MSILTILAAIFKAVLNYQNYNGKIFLISNSIFKAEYLHIMVYLMHYLGSLFFEVRSLPICFDFSYSRDKISKLALLFILGRYSDIQIDS